MCGGAIAIKMCVHTSHDYACVCVEVWKIAKVQHAAEYP